MSAALGLALFLPRQGWLAGEWMVGGAEAKTWAYGLLLLAFALWCQGRRLRPAALLAGLACSFHALVGLYGAAGLLLLEVQRRRRQSGLPWHSGLGLLLLPFLLGAFALVQPMRQQAGWGKASAESVQAGSPGVSWIYVQLRLPHHLAPLSWSSSHWQAALGPLLILALVVTLWRWLCKRRPQLLAAAGLQPGVMAAFGAWVGLAAGLFVLGLIVAPFDPQGHWLRFYPFRLADSLLPLLLALLLTALLQVWLAGRKRGCGLALALTVLLVASQAPAVHSGTLWLPGAAFEPRVQRRGLNVAIQALTPANSVLLTPPVGFEDLAWRLQRSTVVQFKLFPSQSLAIAEWYRRLTAVVGGPPEQSGRLGFDAVDRLRDAYGRLSPEQLQSLARRYGVAAVVTTAEQAGPTGWRRGYRDPFWTLWQP